MSTRDASDLIYKLTDTELADCEHFAATVRPTNQSCYASRGQSNPSRLYQQILQGKIGETAVYKLFGTSPPDFTIYNVRDKNYAPDLTATNGAEIEVKTQLISDSVLYSPSWVFTKSSPIVRRPEPHWQIALTQLTDDLETVFIATPETLVATAIACWGRPLSRFVNNKSVLYKHRLIANNFLLADLPKELKVV